MYSIIIKILKKLVGTMHIWDYQLLLILTNTKRNVPAAAIKKLLLNFNLKFGNDSFHFFYGLVPLHDFSYTIYKGVFNFNAQTKIN